jgi:hypothetical protein
VACAAVLVADAGRYLPPAGSRFVDQLEPGGADLIPSVNAANALLYGQNPYHAASVFVADPYAASRGSGQGFTYLYPPSHALLYVPLTWLADGDYVVAQRLQFGVELLCIGLLAWCVLTLLGAVVSLPRSTRLGLFPVLCLLLALNPGNQLGIERGQSDLITAALGWCAVVAFQRRWLATFAFLCVASTVLKGYGVLFATGLLVLGLGENWRRTMAGASASVALLFAPVAGYLPDALAAYRIRSAMFWSSWNNQSFANLGSFLGFPREDSRRLLTAAALGCTALAWLQLKSVLKIERDAGQRALWTSAFATASFVTVLGYSLNSIAYACVIVMPGALVLAIGQNALVTELSAKPRVALGVWLSASLGALFVFDVGHAVGVSRWHLPAHAAAQVAILLVIGAAAAWELGRASRFHRIALCSVGLAMALGAALYLVSTLLRAWLAGPDLAAGRAWTASSTAMTCEPARHNCGGKEVGVFFHTRLEQQPWLRIDLGGEHQVSSVELQNRQDCCQERALPLVVELSVDGLSWQQVARRTESFETWRAEFPPRRARFVRLRVTRRSVLHLERVSVR